MDKKKHIVYCVAVWEGVRWMYYYGSTQQSLHARMRRHEQTGDRRPGSNGWTSLMAWVAAGHHYVEGVVSEHATSYSSYHAEMAAIRSCPADQRINVRVA